VATAHLGQTSGNSTLKYNSATATILLQKLTLAKAEEDIRELPH